jgi:predicted restriction endonuclease
VTLPKADRIKRIRREYLRRYPGLAQTLRDLFSDVLIDEQGSLDTDSILEAAQRQFEQFGAFDPANVRDARTRTLSLIVQRQGQFAFRKRLLAAYVRKCAITGCPIEELLEAAHIVPYKGQQTNHSGNGILLRADLHTLFDLYLIAIDESSMRVLVSPKLNGSDYEQYRGKVFRAPKESGSRPSSDALKCHRRLYESGGQIG